MSDNEDILQEVAQHTADEKEAEGQQRRTERARYLLASLLIAMFSFFIVHGYTTDQALKATSAGRSAQLATSNSQQAQTNSYAKQISAEGVYLITIEQSICLHTPGCTFQPFVLPVIPKHKKAHHES